MPEITPEDVRKAEELLETSRDELADALRAKYRAIVVEADDWRMLASHVLELAALAVNRKASYEPPICSSNDIVIDRYTGTWSEAMRPGAPDIGSKVLLPHSRTPDGRERDEFMAVLRKADLALLFHSTAGSESGLWDVFEVRRVWGEVDPGSFIG